MKHTAPRETELDAFALSRRLRLVECAGNGMQVSQKECKALEEGDVPHLYLNHRKKSSTRTRVKNPTRASTAAQHSARISFLLTCTRSKTKRLKRGKRSMQDVVERSFMNSRFLVNLHWSNVQAMACSRLRSAVQRFEIEVPLTFIWTYRRKNCSNARL